MKKINLFFIVFFATVFLGQMTNAAAVTINFDDYPTGPLTFASSTRYQPQGVVFSRDIPIYSVALVEPDWWVQTFQTGGGTLPNVLALSEAVDPRPSIEMSFVVPGTATPAITDFVSALFADSEVGSTIGLFEAFDINGDLIASTSPSTPDSSTAIVQFSMPGIARVRFTNIDDGFEIDNITFNTPVPPGGPFQIIGISSSLAANPQPEETFRLIMNAAAPEETTVNYRFYYKGGYGSPAWNTKQWQLAQDWSTQDWFDYSFPVEDNYYVVVQGVPEGETWTTGDPQGGFTVDLWGDVQIKDVTSNLTDNPQTSQTFRITMEAVGPEGVSLHYRFYYKSGYGTPSWSTNKWQVVQEWSPVNYCDYSFAGPDNYYLIGHVVPAGEGWVTGDPQGGFTVVVEE